MKIIADTNIFCPLFTLDVAMKALAAKLGIAIWEEKA